MKTILFKYWIILTLILIIISPTRVFSQLEAKYWYFGYYCGLKFENDTPRVVTDGKMFTNMGSACISDKNGNLLFYTDGLTIWNKNHDTLKNGAGLYSSQSGSSVQGAIIIPLSGNPNLYYVFTVSGNVRPNPGFWYHIVDISKDNGKGEVILKNQYICGNVTERMSATLHADKKSVWIMVHEWNSDKFRAYLLKNNGLDTNEVVSSIGTIHTGYIANNMGQLKFSASGKNMACVIWEDGIVDIFDFNNKTGMLSNCISINLGYSKAAFGTEFSPNEQLLYVSTNKPEGIYQIDLSSNIDSVIKNSGKYIYRESNPNSSWFLALQIGLNKKIYLARMYRELGCINDPNNLGSACNFVEKAITFPLATAAGLPTFLQSYFYLPDIVIRNTCLSDTTEFGLRDTFNIDSVYWHFSDSSSSWSYYPFKVYTDTGNYKVNAIIYYDNTSDTFERTFRISNYPNASFSITDTSQCPDGNQFHFSNTSSAVDGAMTYEWDFGDSTKSFQQNPVKSYLLSDAFDVRLTVTSAYGCESSFYDTLIVYPKPKANFSINDSAQCFNENSFIFYDSSTISSGTITYNWDFRDSQTINTSQNQVKYSYQNPVSHNYPVRLIAVSDQGCKDTIIKHAIIYPSPTADFSINDSAQCFNEQNFVINDLSAITDDSITQTVWQWDTNTIINQSSISFNNLQPGTLNLKLITSTSHGCPDTIEKQLIVYPPPLANFSINDPNQCYNEQGFVVNDQSKVMNDSIINWNWLINDSIISNSKSINNLTLQKTGTYNLELVSFTNHGCPDTVEKQLIVFSNPTMSFLVSDTGQCFNGNNFSFNNLSTSSDGQNINSFWDLGEITSNQKNISYSFKIFGTKVITLVSGTDSGCYDTVEFQIKVFPSPIADFIVNDSVQCLPYNRFDFTNTSTISSDTLFSLWDFGDSTNSTSASHIYAYHSTGSFRVKLTVTSLFGCSDSEIKNVIVCPAAKIYSVTNGSHCGPGQVFLQANALNGNISWYASFFGGALLDTGNLYTTDILSSSAIFYAEATNAGCSSSRSSVQANIITVPSIVSTIPQSRVGPGSVILYAEPSAGSVGWYDVPGEGNQLFSGNTFLTPYLTATTTFYAEAQYKGCSSYPRTAVTASLPNGINSMADQVNVIVYPNPAQDFIILSVQGFMEPAKLEIRDIQGRIMKTVEIEHYGLDYNQKIDLLGFEQGIYNLILMNKKVYKTFRIVKF